MLWLRASEHMKNALIAEKFYRIKDQTSRLNGKCATVCVADKLIKKTSYSSLVS